MPKGGKFDFSEIEKFRDELEDFQKHHIDELACSILKEITARFLRKVIKRTPVGVKPKVDSETLKEYWQGYVGGTLRRGWTAKTEEEAKNGEGNGDINKFLNDVKVYKSGKKYFIEIINPVRYSPYVEYGHVQEQGRYVPALGKKLNKGFVEGRYMMTFAEEDIKNIIPRLVQKRVEENLREFFR